jgi:hypothetical protein
MCRSPGLKLRKEFRQEKTDYQKTFVGYGTQQMEGNKVKNKDEPKCCRKFAAGYLLQKVVWGFHIVECRRK